jgi:hypothetical protein
MIRLINIPPSEMKTRPPVERSRRSDTGPAAAGAPRADQVEFSEEGLALSLAVSDSTLRIMRIAAVRDEIRAGTYETTQRIEGAVDRLLKLFAS